MHLNLSPKFRDFGKKLFFIILSHSSYIVCILENIPVEISKSINGKLLICYMLLPTKINKRGNMSWHCCDCVWYAFKSKQTYVFIQMHEFNENYPCTRSQYVVIISCCIQNDHWTVNNFSFKPTLTTPN